MISDFPCKKYVSCQEPEASGSVCFNCGWLRKYHRIPRAVLARQRHHSSTKYYDIVLASELTAIFWDLTDAGSKLEEIYVVGDDYHLEVGVNRMENDDEFFARVDQYIIKQAERKAWTRAKKKEQREIELATLAMLKEKYEVKK